MKKRTIRSGVTVLVVLFLSAFTLLASSFALREYYQNEKNFAKDTDAQAWGGEEVKSTRRKDNQTIGKSNTSTNVRDSLLTREEINWNDTTDNRIKLHTTKTTDDPPFTWSACMIARDETIALPEWLAYHAMVLPLGRFILGMDPQSKTDPRPILRQFQRDLGLNWTVLEYDDYFKPGKRRAEWNKYNYTHGTRKTGPPLDKDAQYRAHLWRQEKFYERCLEILMGEPGRSWTLFIDTDEFLAYNSPALLSSAVNGSSPSAPHMGLLTKRSISTNSGGKPATMADFLHQNYASLVKAQPNYQKPCWGFTRLDFAAISDDNSPPIGTINFPPSMITLQYRFHAKNPLRRTVKCIVNVAQMDKMRQQPVSVKSPHEILGRDGNCTNAPFANDYEKAFFNVHHYATSLSHFLARGKSLGDFMSRQPSSNRHRLIESYDGTWWWPRLIERVGWEVAQNLTVNMEAWAQQEYQRAYKINRTNSSAEDDMKVLLNLSSYKVTRFNVDLLDWPK